MWLVVKIVPENHRKQEGLNEVAIQVDEWGLENDSKNE